MPHGETILLAALDSTMGVWLGLNSIGVVHVGSGKDSRHVEEILSCHSTQQVLATTTGPVTIDAEFFGSVSAFHNGSRVEKVCLRAEVSEQCDWAGESAEPLIKRYRISLDLDEGDIVTFDKPPFEISTTFGRRL